MLPSVDHELRSRWSRWLTQDRAALISIAVVALIALWPIWSARFLPLLDEAGHLSTLSVWARLRDPSSMLHQFYEPRVAFVPYFLHYAVGYLISFFTEVEAAHKLALSLYVSGFSLAGYAWCRRAQRPLWLVVPVPLLAYNISWAHGYHAFNLGIPTVLLALAAFDALLERLSWPGVIVAIIGTIACYLAHAVLFVLLVGLTLLLLVLRRPARASLVTTLTMLVLAMFAFVLEAKRSTKGAKVWQALADDGTLRITPQRIADRATAFFSNGFNVISGRWDETLGGLLIAVALISAAFVYRRARRLEAGSVRMLTIAGAITFGYLLAPEHLTHPEYMWIFAGRFVPIILFFLLLGLPIEGVHAPRICALLGTTVLLIAVLHIGARYRAFVASIRDLPDAVAQCPKPGTLLVVGMPPFTHREVNVDVLGGRLGSWAHLIQGDFNPYYFARRVPFPFKVTHPLPAPAFRDPAHYGGALKKGDYDCVLTHQLRAPLASRDYDKVFDRGAFTVWKHKPRKAR